MKIAFYVAVNKGNSTDYELREFEVSEIELAEILEIAQTHGRVADTELHDVDAHLIVNGQHFEFDSENLVHFEKIKSGLLKGKQKELKKPVQIIVDDETTDEEDKDIIFAHDDLESLDRTSFLAISDITHHQPAVTLEADANGYLRQWIENLRPIAAIQNQYKEIETLKAFPQVLSDCARDVDNFQRMLDQFDSELDFSGYSDKDQQRESELKQKLASLEELSKIRHYFYERLNAAKRLHHSILKSNTAFSDRLGKVDEKTLGENYASLLSALENLNELIIHHRQQVKLELAKITERKCQNTIIIRTWYASKSDEDQREMFGIPSDGHTTVELYRNNGDRIYLGFYVCPNKDKSTIGKAFKKVKLPSPDPGRGYFVSLEYDQSLVGPGKKYSRCETVVIKCDRPGAELDFEAAYDWAQKTMAKYLVKTAHGRSIRIIDDYNFYNNNCASFGAVALRKAGAGAYSHYSGKTVIDIDTPTGVRQYALALEKKLERMAVITKREAEISSDTGMSTQKKGVKYLRLAVERLKLIDDSPVLLKLIEEFGRARDELKDLRHEEVDNFLNDLFGRLYITVNDLINGLSESAEDTIPDAEEIIGVIKHLTSLLPVQDYLLIKAMNSTLKISLYPFNILHAKRRFGEFEADYLAANEIVGAIAQDDSASLVSKTLHIRAALLKLDNKYQAAQSKFKKLAAENKSQPKKLEELQKGFENIREYHHAAFKQLKEALTELRNQIYLRPDMIGQNNALLKSLQNMFLPGVKLQGQFTLPVILQHAKGENYWAAADKSLDDITEEDQKKIFFKTASPVKGLPAPEKTHVLAFWNWGKRHQHFEVENKGKLYNIVNDAKYDWQTKLRLISELVEDSQPGVLKFWRRAERHRYDDMGARAAIICLIQAFSEGKVSEARMVVELEKVIPKLAESGRAQMLAFSKNLAAQYRAGVKSQASSEADSPAMTHARVLRKLLKSVATSEQTYGDTFEDLGVRLYSAHHHQQLKCQKDSQQPRPKDVRVVTPEEQVEIETGLWRRLS